ncbi:MAG: nuclear transport factor 2 family protein [Planctomycetes bacterium]|nr:nuclear transport factor 2 family protein [Planctomycetota bacterium]
MEDDGWVKRLFSSVDKMDTEAFLGFLEDDALFRFGSEQVVTGKEAIGKTIEGFFASIKDLRHDILETWFVADAVICQGEVTYTRVDDSDITIPFVNILRMQGNRIREYLIYIDIKPLYSTTT